VGYGCRHRNGVNGLGTLLACTESVWRLCPPEEWAENLGWQSDALTPEGTTVARGWIGDTNGQRAVVVRFENITTPKKDFCASFQRNAQERGWTALPAKLVNADTGGTYCGIVATKDIDSRRAYVFMGPTGFYAAPHRLDA